jgi:type IV pilus assembly protein PilN
MMRINLLPHREEKRKARQKQFAILAGLAAVVGLALAGMIWFVFDSQVDNQNGRNKYLTGEIASLEKQIEEIRRIREETASLLAKKQVVEGLQTTRSEPVHLLDQLLRQLPEGLYLKSIKQTGIKVNVTGYAQSNARVSAFMRNIEASPYLEAPNLIEIKAVTLNSQRANEFSLDFAIKRTRPDDGKAGARKADPAKPAEKKA